MFAIIWVRNLIAEPATGVSYWTALYYADRKQKALLRAPFSFYLTNLAVSFLSTAPSATETGQFFLASSAYLSKVF